MKLKIWGLLLLLTGTALAAEGIYLPNTKKFATGTATGASQGLDVNIVGGSLVFSESAISSIGDPISSIQVKMAGGIDGSGNAQALLVDNTGKLQVVISSSALPSGAATSGNQTTAQTSLSSIVTNTTKTPINLTGSGSSAGATVSTVATLSAPSNAIGFILMNLDTSSANIRWAVGRTASTTLGQQLQPGRDTGFVPIGASVSVIAESGTQNIDIQWIAQ